MKNFFKIHALNIKQMLLVAVLAACFNMVSLVLVFKTSEKVAEVAIQPAHAGALSDYAENKIIDAIVRGQTLSAPATWYMRLNTTTCTDSASGTEVSGGSYARPSVAASLAAWAGTQGAGTTTASSGTSGTTSNNAAINFATPTASWGTVVSLEWMDAATGGNSWVCTPLTISKTINTGDSVSFPAASLTNQIDN